MSYTRFLTWNPTKLRWRDLRSQLCFFLFLSGKEKGYFWKHWIVFSCTVSFLGQLLPCYALVHERRPRFCHRDLLSLLAINKLYVFQWGQKTFLGVPKQKWRRVLIHKFFALSGLQNCNRKLSLIQIFFRAGIKTNTYYLLSSIQIFFRAGINTNNWLFASWLQFDFRLRNASYMPLKKDFQNWRSALYLPAWEPTSSGCFVALFWLIFATSIRQLLLYTMTTHQLSLLTIF